MRSSIVKCPYLYTERFGLAELKDLPLCLELSETTHVKLKYAVAGAVADADGLRSSLLHSAASWRNVLAIRAGYSTLLHLSVMLVACGAEELKEPEIKSLENYPAKV